MTVVAFFFFRLAFRGRECLERIFEESGKGILASL